MKFRIVAASCAALLLVAACSDDGDKTENPPSSSVSQATQPSAPSSAPQPAPLQVKVAPDKAALFTGVVSLESFGGVCETEKCWLPTQLSAKVVNGQSVALPEIEGRPSWPNEGDQFHVLGRVKGEVIRDKTRTCTSDLWYLIALPQQWVDPAMLGRVKQANTSYKAVVAYVSAQWVKRVDGKTATGTSEVPCKVD